MSKASVPDDFPPIKTVTLKRSLSQYVRNAFSWCHNNLQNAGVAGNVFLYLIDKINYMFYGTYIAE